MTMEHSRQLGPFCWILYYHMGVSLNIDKCKVIAFKRNRSPPTMYSYNLMHSIFLRANNHIIDLDFKLGNSSKLGYQIDVWYAVRLWKNFFIVYWFYGLLWLLTKQFSPNNSIQAVPRCVTHFFEYGSHWFGTHTLYKRFDSAWKCPTRILKTC